MKEITKILRKPYSFLLTPEENGRFSAKVTEFSGCFADGDTIGEAADNLLRAAEAWVEGMLEDGQEVPIPDEESVYCDEASTKELDDAYRLGAKSIYDMWLKRMDQLLSWVQQQRKLRIEGLKMLCMVSDQEDLILILNGVFAEFEDQIRKMMVNHE